MAYVSAMIIMVEKVVQSKFAKMTAITMATATMENASVVKISTERTVPSLLEVHPPQIRPATSPVQINARQMLRFP